MHTILLRTVLAILLAAALAGCGEVAVGSAWSDAEASVADHADVLAGDAIDAADAIDTADAVVPQPPRLIAPLSTARVTSSRPTLHWDTNGGGLVTHVRICADRACAHIEMESNASGGVFTPTSDLSAGVHFWSVQTNDSRSSITTPTWEFFVPHGYGSVDTSWGSTPDFDGDGLADIAIAIGHEDAAAGGYVYVYRGRTGALPSTPDTTIPADGVSVVANVGDVNGDGFGDLAIRRICVEATGADDHVEIHFGGPSGPARAVGASFAWHGNTCEFGRAVIAAGDINRDGYGDIVVESPERAHTLGGFGSRVEVFNGSATGPGATSSDAVEGGNEYQGFGGPVAVGDMDGDGFADVAVTLHGGFMYASLFAPRVYVYRGGATGISASLPVAFASPAPGDATFGAVVASGVDIDADGRADLVVDAEANTDPADPGSTLPWRVYAFAGSAAISAGAPTSTWMLQLAYVGFSGPESLVGGDLDGDGFDDVVITPPIMAGSPLQVAHGSASGLPRSSTQVVTLPSSDQTLQLGACRDVDGDGLLDVVGSASTVDGSGTTTGWGVIVFRGAATLGLTPDAPLAVPMSSGAYAFPALALRCTPSWSRGS